MTYFGFLARFLGLPILLLLILFWLDRRAGRRLPAALQGAPPLLVLAAHVLIALLYTTPWDNYLVATRVWWYDPALVTGLTLGWVPIEEYLFFVLQPLLTGLWLLWLARRLPRPAVLPDPAWRWFALGAGGLLWFASLVLLLSRWQPGTYLALEMVWALPPILLQLAVGADILWQQRRLVLLALLPSTIFLSAADALAIGTGTWTINPAQSLELYLGNVLPVEELLFFFLTNMLITFGMTLALSQVTGQRLRRWWAVLPGQKRRLPHAVE